MKTMTNLKAHQIIILEISLTLINTCKSTERGTLVSSILAARDRQATTNNCTVQTLPF